MLGRSDRPSTRRLVMAFALVPALVALGSFTSVPRQQSRTASASTGETTGAISGVVRDGRTGSPVSQAVVALQSDSARNGPLRSSVSTDGLGRFVFSAVSPAVDYTLAAPGPSSPSRRGASTTQTRPSI